MCYRVTRYLQAFHGLMGDQRILGRHISVSKHRYAITKGLMGMGLDHCIHYEFHALCLNMLHDYVLCVM